EHRILLEKHGVTVVLTDPARGFWGIDDRASAEVEQTKGVLLHAPSRNEDALRIFCETIGAELAAAIREHAELQAVETIVAPLGSGALLRGVGSALADAGIEVALVGTIAAKRFEPTRQDGVAREDDVASLFPRDAEKAHASVGRARLELRP